MNRDLLDIKRFIENSISLQGSNQGQNNSEREFEKLALEIFHFQVEHNAIYRAYVNNLGVDISKVSGLTEIPFLPISFFKSHEVVTGKRENNSIIFKSSSTTSDTPSKHIVKDVSMYESSFRKGFELFYADIKEYCLLALLPSYLERGDSSLVYMVNDLIKDSGNPDSGFYMDNYQELANKLKINEKKGKKTLLIGVTYALLKLAEEYPMELKNTTIMETGGMKGRREELTREEVHRILSNAFKIENIHSEYGMTELLSQAYSKGKGVFQCVPWMMVLIRDVYDPFRMGLINESGAINIIDLANINSCSFIATDDLGIIFPNGDFEVAGRLDSSDIRGCNIMASEL
ncbi:MAG TPA: acyl transferase [Bacteroidia bacterium]|jgi:hypothetical protein|nr:acyl transferase [Bacteroidia bacterium]